VTFLTQPQRRAVLDKVLTLVETKFSGPDVNVRQIRDVHETRVLNSETPEDFEQALNGLPIDNKARAEINELTETLKANLGKIEQHGKRFSLKEGETLQLEMPYVE